MPLSFLPALLSTHRQHIDCCLPVHGWHRIECAHVGEQVDRTLQPFQATWRSVVGVNVREKNGWTPFGCIDMEVGAWDGRPHRPSDADMRRSSRRRVLRNRFRLDLRTSPEREKNEEATESFLERTLESPAFSRKYGKKVPASE